MPRYFADDDVPKPKFKLRPKHALILVDLVLVAAIFYATGQFYVRSYGQKLVMKKEAERAAAQLESARMIEQADSVAAAAGVAFQDMQVAHDQTMTDVKGMRDELEAQIVRTQHIGQGIFRLSDMVLDLRERSQEASKGVRRYDKEVNNRSSEIDSLQARAARAESRLTLAMSEKSRTDSQLAALRGHETYDPTGRFPSGTGVVVRRDFGDQVDLTNVELQKLLWNPGSVDVGLALGVGLGSNSDKSNKEFGLLLYRPLIHRRLGLDFGAGLSFLTEADGAKDNGTYASASLRLSPFFKERVHVGLGARATHGEIVPFLGLAVGRK